MKRIILPFLLLSACPNDEDMPGGNTSSTGTTGSSSPEPTSDGGDSMSATSAEPTDTGDTSTGDTSTGDTGDTSTTGDTGELTTTAGETGLSCFSLQDVLDDPEVLAEKCKQHPWVRADDCMPNPELPSCEAFIKTIAEHEGCGDIDLCDYILCAEAMAVAACNERPMECATIIACLNPPAQEI